MIMAPPPTVYQPAAFPPNITLTRHLHPKWQVHLLLADNHDVHVRDAERDGDAGVPLHAQDLHHHSPTGEKQPGAVHHVQDDTLSYRQSRRVSHIQQELELILEYRLAKV